MVQEYEILVHIEGELRAPVARAQLVRFNFAEPIDKLTRFDDTYRLDLCLTPRPANARVRYLDHWSASQFEQIGTLFLTPAGEAVHHRSDGWGEQSSIICELQPDSLSAWLEQDLRWTDYRLKECLDIRDSHIQGLLLRLARETRQPGLASDTMVELIVSQLALEITRFVTREPEDTAGGGLAPWRLRLIDERLREEGAPPTLTELSALCRLSVRQLTRGFRASRSCSIGDYITGRRIEQARKLLASDRSVKAVAYSLGFSSPSSFCYAFRRATGETPRQYRARFLRVH